MQPTVETLSGLERRISLSVSLEEVEQEVDKRLKSLSRTFKMPGFRPGKVPMKIVANTHGQRLRLEVLNDKLGQVFSTAISQHQLRIAGGPKIEPQASPDEKNMQFAAVFEVLPEVQLPTMADIEVKRAVTPVGEQEIANTIDILRTQRTVFMHEPGRQAQTGDQLTIDFVGTLEGVAFEGGSASDFTLVLGQKTLLPDFEDALMGMKSEEQKTFAVNFPENYGATNLAGKLAQFTVTLKRVEAAQLPELDHGFITGLGVVEGTVEALQSEVKINLDREVTHRLAGRTKNHVMQALIDNTKFDVPKSMRDAEVEQLLENARQTLTEKGVPNAETAQLPVELFHDQADRRVRLGLIFSELSRQHSIRPTAAQIRTKLEALAATYQQPEQIIQWYMSDKQRLSNIETIVLEDNLVAWVLEHAKTVEEPVAFSELMGTT